MNKAEIVKQVKQLFNMEVEVETQPVSGIEKEKMAEAKLKDGVVIVSPDEEFVVGSEVFVLAEDGSQSPAPDAEHELEDGTIVVTVEGKIVEIKPVEVEEPEADVEEEVLSKVSVEEFNKLTERVKELEEKLVEKSEFENSFKAVKDATVFLAEEFAKMPGAEKIEVEKTGLTPEEKSASTKEEKFMKLLKSIRK